ncbi:geranylgeranyl transferase type ii alpha subunit [Lecanosticta acicola]|uniref:Geranylgeranyl transferase type-2 subunit alpha n=1 Tax=Lecanosticta acicola TaxID=111012 RepID=A0AAI8Z2Y3_9PEZI|nr:geranylgeranyl transferase type ii alpha subunit [Lecanosticta acicola]
MASHGVPRVSAAHLLDKSDQARAKERKQIEEYKALEKEVTDKIRSGDYSNTSLQLTSKLLSRNPEYYTIWNHRRLILQDVFARELAANTSETRLEEADAAAARKDGLTVAQREITLLIKEDLQFLIPLLKQYPKCYWIWNHRRWLLTTATTHIPSHASVLLWEAELGLVTKMLSLDSRNFHGWGYRREVVDNLGKLGGKSMVEPEFQYTTKMIQSNLSNFSAWHNRGQLIPRLLNERHAGAEERRKLLDEEFEMITKALYTDPYDQSLWNYHQYLMSAFDPTNPRGPEILTNCTNADRLFYLEQEIDGIRDMLDGAEDCKYIYQALLDYSRRYLEIDAGNKKVTTAEMKGWLDELRKIDPLREGRWNDLALKLDL